MPNGLINTRAFTSLLPDGIQGGGSQSRPCPPTRLRRGGDLRVSTPTRFLFGVIA